MYICTYVVKPATATRFRFTCSNAVKNCHTRPVCGETTKQHTLLHTVYLDGLGSLQRLFGRDTRFPLSQQLLDEVGDVPTGDGDVLDAAAYHVALRLHSSVERMRGGGGGGG